MTLQVILVRLVDSHNGLHMVVPSNDGHLYVIDGITGELLCQNSCSHITLHTRDEPDRHFLPLSPLV